MLKYVLLYLMFVMAYFKRSNVDVYVLKKNIDWLIWLMDMFLRWLGTSKY